MGADAVAANNVSYKSGNSNTAQSRWKQSDTLFKGTKMKISEPETGIWKG